jgi:ubiquinone/menaquinone biosynthesis C-methylase UbiE
MRFILRRIKNFIRKMLEQLRFGFWYNPKKYWTVQGVKYKNEFHNRFLRRLKESGHDRNISLIIDTLKKYKFDSFLDVGCGYGLYLKHIEKAFPFVSRIDGCDISPTMLAEAKIFLGADSRAMLNETNGRHLPYKDKSFDVVFTYSVCIHVPHKQIAEFVGEILRVAKSRYIFMESSVGKDSFYYFSHDYPKIFGDLGVNLKILKEVDGTTNEKLYEARLD